MNNLLLAILLKNFRWLFFRLRLNNPLIVQGVSCSSLRYSIYKVQAAASRQLVYDTISRRVCQALFHKFRHDFLYAFIAHSCAFMADFFSPRPPAFRLPPTKTEGQIGIWQTDGPESLLPSLARGVPQCAHWGERSIPSPDVVLA